MALNSEKFKTVFACIGGTTYDFDFKVFDEDDLEVILYTIATGTETVLVLGAGAGKYTVSALTDIGGRVTTGTAYTALYQLVVRRKQPHTQDIDYTQNDQLSTPVLERQLDEVVMMIQGLQEEVDRSVKVDAVETTAPDYADLIAGAAAAAAASAAVSAASAVGSAASAANAAGSEAAAAGSAWAAGVSAAAAAQSAIDAAGAALGVVKAVQADSEAAVNDALYMTPLQVKYEVQKSGAVAIPVANVVGAESTANKDTDGTLAANSDTKYPSQKATKTYADTKIASSALDTDGTLAANSDAKVATQKAVKTYVDNLGGLGYNIQVFTSSGTWSRPVGVDYVSIEVVGGGAGGISGAGSSPNYVPGGGGGGGGYCNKICNVIGDVVVTVGAGGAIGTNGGNSSFGSFCTANGGSAGSSSNGGLGGTAIGGDLNCVGQDGSNAADGSANSLTTRSGGNGGCSHYGGGGRGSITNAVGLPGNLYGGGGGGGGGYNSPGGVGAAGIVIVRW